MDDKAIGLWAKDLSIEIGGVKETIIKRVLIHAVRSGGQIPERYLIEAFQICHDVPRDAEKARKVLVEMGWLPKVW